MSQDVNISVEDTGVRVVVGDAASASIAASQASASAAAASASASSASSSSSSAVDAANAAAGSASDAASYASSALASASEASTSAYNASVSSASAATSASNAIAAANASGNVIIYNTKAAANAALSGLAEGQVIEVIVDESRSNQRTRYRKTSGAYVYLLTLSSASSVYVNSISGSDSNDGLSPTTPKLTLSAAITTAQSLPSPGIFYIARGSHFFVAGLAFANLNNWRFTTYGSGLKPIIDHAYDLSVSPYSNGVWVQDPTYTNLWKLDVTIRGPGTTTAAANWSTSFIPSVWDEANVMDDPRDTRLTCILRGYYVNGVQISTSATQAQLLSQANSTPGSFTIFKTGSSNPDTLNDLGTIYTYYVNLRDGSNPNTNSRIIRISDNSGGVAFANGNSVEDIIFQRAGGKDGVSISNSLASFTSVVRCEFLYPRCHGILLFGAEARDCRAVSAFPPWAFGVVVGQGGGFHEYNDGTYGQSRGFKVYNCYVEGFATGVYTHGSIANVEHYKCEVEGLTAHNCIYAVQTGYAVTGVDRLSRIRATECYTLMSSSNNVIVSDSVIMKSGLVQCYSDSKTITFERVFVYGNTGFANSAGSSNPANFNTLNFVDTTIAGEIADPGNSLNTPKYFNLNLTRSVVGTFAKDYFLGTVTTDATSAYLVSGLAAEDLITNRPTVNANVITGWRKQIFEKTIVLSDLTAVPLAGYTFAYSGTDNGDGTANLTGTPSNPRTLGRYIRITDAYGAGSHYYGVIVNQGATGTDPLVVSPPPTSAFTGKACAFMVFNKSPYKDNITAYISSDGTQLNVPDGTMFRVGNSINVTNPVPNRPAFGTRRITAISGNILTLDRACVWSTSSTATPYNAISTPTAATYNVLPQVTLSFGFPFRVVNTAAGATGPVWLLTQVNGGTSGGQQDPTYFSFTNNNYVRTDYAPDGSTKSAYRGVNCTIGFYEVGFMIAVGDVLKITADAQIANEALTFTSDPSLTLDYCVDKTCQPYIRGAGYKPRFNYVMP